MFSIARIFEVMIATAFYSGLVYMFYDGTGKAPGDVAHRAGGVLYESQHWMSECYSARPVYACLAARMWTRRG